MQMSEVGITEFASHFVFCRNRDVPLLVILSTTLFALRARFPSVQLFSLCLHADGTSLLIPFLGVCL